MISMKVPSKTFLLGEYSVLHGGVALIISTQPYFHFTATRNASDQIPWHLNSPAGQWCKISDVLLREWKITATDPHSGQGGFGFSGAQFVFSHALTTYLQAGRLKDNPADVWQDFRACDKSGGSGGDVVAQTLGGITCFQMDPFQANIVKWPFDDVALFILRTGEKQETHAHLERLRTMVVDFANLKSIAQASVDAFVRQDEERFLMGVGEFQSALVTNGLQSETTTELLQRLRDINGYIVGKGCGAMGADTVAVFVRSEQRDSFAAQVKNVVATDRDFALGSILEVH